MDITLNGFDLQNLPPDNAILTKKGTDLPEVVGYATLAEALSGVNPKILMVSYLLKYGLKKALLTDGVYIPLPYGTKDSNQVVLVYCGYELALEQFYNNIAMPLGLSGESIKLFFDKYATYIGERQEREEAEKLNGKLAELSLLTGKSVDDLRKKVLAIK